MDCKDIKVWTSKDKGKVVLFWQVGGAGRKRLTLGNKVTKAAIKEAVVEKYAALRSQTGPVVEGRIRLGTLRDLYLEARAQTTANGSERFNLRTDFKALEPSTLVGHRMTLRYLVGHFGESCYVDSIDQTAVNGFCQALKDGKLAHVRKATNQNGEPNKRHFTLAKNGVKLHVSYARTIWNWACHDARRLLAVNPWLGMETKRGVASKAQIPLEVFELVFDYCKAEDPGLGVQLALCRLGGLRLKEAATLPWSSTANDWEGQQHWVGIDWEGKRICLVGTSKGAKSRTFRDLPIRARLLEILTEAEFAMLASGGDGRVVARPISSIDRDARKAWRKATGSPPPSPFFNSLRSSAENDWGAGGVAETSYCRWLGHSPTTSQQHYRRPTDAEFSQGAAV